MSLPWKWARTQINHLWKPFIDPSQNQIELVWSQLWKNLVPGRIHHVCGSKPWLQKFVQHAAQDGELKNIRSPASLLRPSPSPRKIHQRKAGCWTSTTRRSRCRLTWWPLWSLGIISRLNLTLSREVQSLRSPYIHSETNSILPHKNNSLRAGLGSFKRCWGRSSRLCSFCWASLDQVLWRHLCHQVKRLLMTRTMIIHSPDIPSLKWTWCLKSTSLRWPWRFGTPQNSFTFFFTRIGVLCSLIVMDCWLTQTVQMPMTGICSPRLVYSVHIMATSCNDWFKKNIYIVPLLGFGF